MKNNVLANANIFHHNWDNNDIIIWNNRKLIHTSSPTIEYNNEHEKRNRMFIQCFLATREPILSCNSEPIFHPIIINKSIT